MSWLRRQALETFRHHNPDWECNLIGAPDFIAEREMGVSHEADWTCWHTLYEKGGFVMDTDIVFVAPMPEEWLDADMCAQTSGTGTVFQFAAIGAIPGLWFFKDASTMCRKATDSCTPIGWSTFGVPLLARLTNKDIYRLVPRLFDMPQEAFCKYHWNDDVESLWSNEGPAELPGPEVVGVHWYGGHHISEYRERSSAPDGTSWLERLATTR